MFGTDTDQVQLAGQAQLSVRLAAMNRQIAARRFSPTPLPPKAARPGPGPHTAEMPFQVTYKGHLICASQGEDGSWIATCNPLDPPPLSGAPRTHRFMARILAIASVEIEIDDLESTNRA
jgi:hypothetical protein